MVLRSRPCGWRNPYGYNNLPKMLAALCVENVRLTKEVNEHRAARGIDPLETYEV